MIHIHITHTSLSLSVSTSHLERGELRQKLPERVRPLLLRRVGPHLCVVVCVCVCFSVRERLADRMEVKI